MLSIGYLLCRVWHKNCYPLSSRIKKSTIPASKIEPNDNILIRNLLGQRLTDFAMEDLSGRIWHLNEIDSTFKVIIIFSLEDCPQCLGHRDLNANKISFFFDIFDSEGNWLLSFPSTELNTGWVRKVTTDSHGNLYLDFMEPFPHIRKFSSKFIERTHPAPQPGPNTRKSKR